MEHSMDLYKLAKALKIDMEEKKQIADILKIVYGRNEANKKALEQLIIQKIYETVCFIERLKKGK